jgi:hypothetical protein
MKTNVRTVELRVHDLPYKGHLSDGITHRPDGSGRLPITVSNTEWRPDGITTSSGRMRRNIGILSNSKDHLDDLPLRPDGCKLELFEASRH